MLSQSVCGTRGGEIEGVFTFIFVFVVKNDGILLEKRWEITLDVNFFVKNDGILLWM